MNNLRNHVLLIGRLGQDIELKKFSNGNQMARVSLATNSTYKKDDEWITETQWHRIVAWGKQAEKMAKQLKKGQQITVQGKLKYTKFEDKNGIPRTVAEIFVNEFMVNGFSVAKAKATEANANA